MTFSAPTFQTQLPELRRPAEWKSGTPRSTVVCRAEVAHRCNLLGGVGLVVSMPATSPSQPCSLAS